MGGKAVRRWTTLVLSTIAGSGVLASTDRSDDARSALGPIVSGGANVGRNGWSAWWVVASVARCTEVMGRKGRALTRGATDTGIDDAAPCDGVPGRAAAAINAGAVRSVGVPSSSMPGLTARRALARRWS